MKPAWIAFFAILVTFFTDSRADRCGAAEDHDANAAEIYLDAIAVLPTVTKEQNSQINGYSKNSIAAAGQALLPIIALFESALAELQRAKDVAKCEWCLGEDLDSELMIAQAKQAFELSRVAIVRARLRFLAADLDAALMDSVAVLKLGRDFSTTPVWMSLLYGGAMERSAVELLTDNLPQLSPRQLETLATFYKGLPQRESLANCFRFEGKSLGDRLERLINAEDSRLNDPNAGREILKALRTIDVDTLIRNTDAEGIRRRDVIQQMTVADVRRSLQKLRDDYEELAKIVSLAPATQADRLAQFSAQLDEDRSFAAPASHLRFLSVYLLPNFDSPSNFERRCGIRQELFLQAISIQRQTPDSLRYPCEYGLGKIEYRKTNIGFELEYSDAFLGKPEVLVVGFKPVNH
jgi:hypothetical protein